MHVQSATGQCHLQRAPHQAALHQHGGGRAGTTAAGQGFAGTALVHPQPDAFGRQHLHETDIHGLRECRVLLQAGFDLLRRATTVPAKAVLALVDAALFGRDSLISRLDAGPGTSVLEVGCGTGRNLALIGKHWPGAALHGLDISSEMLSIAGSRLGNKAQLALGDATDFVPSDLYGRTAFDRIVISYAVSMIRVWREAVVHAATLLAPGGSLNIVDFGDLEGLPGPLRSALRAWLASFHVTPRTDLGAALAAICEDGPFTATTRRGPFGYFQIGVLTRNR